MKTVKNLMKLAAGVAAVAGIAYLVVTYMDTITEWLKKLCPCCKAPAVEEVTEAPAEEAAAEDVVEEVAVEEVPVEDAPAEEAVEEVAPIAEGEPVAEEADFQE